MPQQFLNAARQWIAHTLFADSRPLQRGIAANSVQSSQDVYSTVPLPPTTTMAGPIAFLAPLASPRFATASPVAALYAWAHQGNISEEERELRNQFLCGLWKLPTQELRETLWLEGSLEFRDHPSFTSLPPRLAITEDLIVSGLPALATLPPGLAVRGSLMVEHCPGLTSLQPHLAIDGNLLLQDLPALTALPPGITVGGCLEIINCPALTTIPQDIKVGGDVVLVDCEALVDLPKAWNVGRLCIQNCGTLPQLPTGLRVGHLELHACAGLTHLSDDTCIVDHFSATDCPALTALPPDLTLTGDLVLDNCPALRTLPKRLELGGTLVMGSCHGIDCLPEVLIAKGSLSIRNCDRLTSLPRCFQIGLDLYIVECSALMTVNHTFTVGGNATIAGCLNLRELPEALSIPGNLDLRYNPMLPRLPKRLRVDGDLSLPGCVFLRHIPPDLQVGGTLDLTACLSLPFLPTDMSVGGDLILTGCNSLTTIPNVLGWPRRVDGLPHDIYLNMMRAHFVLTPEIEIGLRSLRNVRLFFFDDVDNGLLHNATFVEAWHFWQGLSITQVPHDLKNQLRRDDKVALARFCSTLAQTADYRNVRTRALLRDRVFDLVAHLHTPALKEHIMALVLDATTSCQDRGARSLDTIEQHVQVQQATHLEDMERLRALGLRYLKLQVIHEHAAQLAGVNTDPVEIYLVFETRLATLLDLPVHTHHMLYHTPVSEAHLTQAAADAQAAAADPNRVEAFLNTWEPWQKQQRRLAAANLVWEELEATQPTPAQQLAQCPITLEDFADLNEPAAIRDRPGIAEYAALLKYWTETATDVLHQPFELTDLRRLSVDG